MVDVFRFESNSLLSERVLMSMIVFSRVVTLYVDKLYEDKRTVDRYLLPCLLQNMWSPVTFRLTHKITYSLRCQTIERTVMQDD